MNLAVISGVGWTYHKTAVESLLWRLEKINSTNTILFDLDSIKRESNNLASKNTELTDQNQPLIISYVNFSKWMKDTNLTIDEINENSIFETPRMISEENIVVIDARSYNFDLISSALNKARQAWHPLDVWHPVFALIVDDVYLLPLLKVMTVTFYSQPRILAEKQTKLIVKKFLHQAALYRWLGPIRVRRLYFIIDYLFKK